MNKNSGNWLLFFSLSFLWGSSFILMKISLEAYSAWQVASLRIVFAGLCLLPFAVRFFRLIPRHRLPYVLLSGVLGNLLPAYLFCLAETGISSTLAGMLNSLTPIFVIVIGALFFRTRTSAAKVAGIVTAFTGSVLMLLSRGLGDNQNLLCMVYVILATMSYGSNVNMVNRYLSGIPSLHIAAVGLALCALPALAVLAGTGFFVSVPAGQVQYKAVGAAAVLGVGGTALASILFYRLMKHAGLVFSSMVTYFMPVVAILWGVVFKEPVGWQQLGCLLLILAGVFVANFEMIVSAARSRMAR